MVVSGGVRQYFAIFGMTIFCIIVVLNQVPTIGTVLIRILAVFFKDHSIANTLSVSPAKSVGDQKNKIWVQKHNSVEKTGRVWPDPDP